jgi:hypothetical protein
VDGTTALTAINARTFAAFATKRCRRALSALPTKNIRLAGAFPALAAKKHGRAFAALPTEHNAGAGTFAAFAAEQSVRLCTAFAAEPSDCIRPFATFAAKPRNRAWSLATLAADYGRVHLAFKLRMEAADRNVLRRPDLSPHSAVSPKTFVRPYRAHVQPQP